MNLALTVVVASTPGIVLRYAAAFFLVIVAIGLVYACIRLGLMLGQTQKMLADVDNEIVPLLKQATETLDGVNTELEKVDSVMATVVDVTDKVDATTRVVESAVSVPARKAAAMGAGISQAVSSFFSRHGDAGAPEATDAEASWQQAAWSAPAAPEASGEAEAAPEPAATSAPDTVAPEAEAAAAAPGTEGEAE